MASVNLKELDNHYHVEFDSNSISILHLPPFQNGFMDWLQSFANVYYAYPNQSLVNHLVSQKLTLSYYKDFFIEKSANKCEMLVGHKSYLCDVALQEQWNTPVLVSKVNNNYILTTGNGRIIAHQVAKKLPQDFLCIFIDYDKGNTDKWNIIERIYTDSDLSKVLNSDTWQLELSFAHRLKSFFPQVTYFAVDKNSIVDNESRYISLGKKTLEFLDSRLNKDNKITIYLHDEYNSRIFDKSGIFEIKKCEEHIDRLLAPGKLLGPNEVRHNSQFGLSNAVEGHWYFHTNQKIRFNLADLLFYVRKDHTIYYNAKNDFITWIECKDHLEKQICTAS